MVVLLVLLPILNMPYFAGRIGVVADGLADGGDANDESCLV